MAGDKYKTDDFIDNTGTDEYNQQFFGNDANTYNQVSEHSQESTDNSFQKANNTDVTQSNNQQIINRHQEHTVDNNYSSKRSNAQQKNKTRTTQTANAHSKNQSRSQMTNGHDFDVSNDKNIPEQENYNKFNTNDFAGHGNSREYNQQFGNNATGSPAPTTNDQSQNDYTWGQVADAMFDNAQTATGSDNLTNMNDGGFAEETGANGNFTSNFSDSNTAARQAAEDRAYEQNPFGTGVDPDIDQSYEYNYDDSELTDVDYQPTDQSSEFTNYGGVNEYAAQFGLNSNGDEEEEDDAGTFRYDDAPPPIISYEGNVTAENWSDDDVENEDTETTETATPQSNPSQNENESIPNNKSVRFGWRKGMHITVQMLNQVYEAMLRLGNIKGTEPFNKVENLIFQAITETGSVSLMFKAYRYVHGIMSNGPWPRTRAMLHLATHMGQRLALTSVASIGALISQQWTEVLDIAKFPKVFETVLNQQPLKPLLEKGLENVLPQLNAQK